MSHNNFIKTKRLYLLLFALMFSIQGQSVYAGDISGTITSYGSPATGVCVNFYQGTNGCNLSYITSTTTNVAGIYTIPFTDGEQFYIGTDANCGGSYPDLYDEYWDGSSSGNTGQSNCSALMAVQAPAANINFDLVQAGTLTGTISDENGLINSTQYPSTGVSIFKGDACGFYDHFGGTNTDNGNFTIKVPITGEYLLRSWSNDAGFISEWYAGANSSQDCGDALTVSFPQGVTDVSGLNFQLDLGGTIKGTVTDSLGPINGNENNVGVQAYTGDACHDHQGVAGRNLESNGTYSLSGLPLDGQFLLRTYSNSDPGYIEEWFAGLDGQNNPMSSQDCSDAVKIDFQQGNTVENVDFLLEPGGTIKGTVTDSLGPINGNDNDVGVQAYTGDACEHHERVMGRNLESDGSYSLSGLPLDGQFLLRTYSNSDPGYIEEWFAGQDAQNNPISSQDCSDAVKIDFQQGNIVENVDFMLEPGGTITGTVADSLGPINGNENNVGVQAYTGDACGHYEHVKGRNLESDGSYSLSGLPLDGQYMVRTYSENNDPAYVEEWYAGVDQQDLPVSSPNCQDAVKIDFLQGSIVGSVDFQIEEGGTIQGTIYDDGVPVTNYANEMGVDIYADFACNNHDWIATDSIDENGNYSVQGLSLDGSYYVRTYTDSAPYLPQWFSGFDNTDQNNPIPLTSDNCADAVSFTFESPNTLIDQIDFDYEESAVIEGTVLGYDNVPLQGACVRAISEKCSNGNDTTLGETWTGSDGSYTLPVPEGDGVYIHVEPECSQQKTANQSGYWTGGEETTDCNAAVKTGPTQIGTPLTGIDFQLNEGAIIEGNVSYNDGESSQGLENVCVTAYTGTICNWPTWINNVSTEQGGDYYFVVPLEQEYYVQTGVNCGDHQLVDKYWNGTANNGTYACDAASTTSAMQSGDSTTVNFVLDPAVEISGLVTDEDTGQPVENIGVFAQLNKCDNSRSISQGYSSSDSGDLGRYSLMVPKDTTIYLETCVNCQDDDTPYLDILYPDITENDCENAQPLLNPVADINFALPKDSDDDDLSDKDEVNIYETDPDVYDTDGDGIDDGSEVWLWNEKADAHPGEEEYAFDGDIDNDGTWNIAETDADKDGVSDLQELARGGDFADTSVTPVALTLYDDFESGTLDPSRWNTSEGKSEVIDGKLHLAADSFGDWRVRIRTPHGDEIKNIRTTATVNEMSPSSGGETWFNLHGFFYLMEDSVNSPDGLVYAAVSIGDEGNGIHAQYYIGVFNENWEITEFTSGELIPTDQVVEGRSYEVEVKYHDGNLFDFYMKDVTSEVPYSLTDIAGPAFGSTVDERRGLSVSTKDSGGVVKVSVESFETSNGNDPYIVYDEFDSSLNTDKWLYLEYAQEIEEIAGDKKLRALTQSYGDRRNINTYFAKRFDYIQTRVKIDDSSFAEGRYVRARIGGMLYNETFGPGSGRPYNGYEGNVWGSVHIQKNSDGTYSASGGADRALDKDYNGYEELFWEDIPIDIQAGKEYILYIGFAKDLIIVGVDSADGTEHGITAGMIETPKYLPYKPTMMLTARADSRNSASDAEGRIVAHFDDIMVSGEPLETPGDVNVDGAVDLKDAILALQAMAGDNSLQTWAAGDVNKDGKIGMPEVITIMSQAIEGPQ